MLIDISEHLCYYTRVNKRGFMSVTISRESVTELRELLEDTVEYWVREQCESGELVSGETAWKAVSALATAKEAQFAGLID